MKKYLLLFMFSSLLSQAQTYKSIVCDSITKQSMPSASIRLLNTNFGTTTNTDGKFSISAKKGKVAISYIGYLTKTLNVNTLPDTIFLSEDNLLNEIVIMPDSALKVLLRKAYNNIEKNYSQKPTYLTGFYQEINESVDSSRFNYFSESMLKVYKPAYTIQGSEYQGQVKVLKTRKVIHPSYENSGIRFYGGPYSPVDDDEVLKRSKFINPRYFKKYEYKLEKITSFEGTPVYVIAFSYKDSVFNGKIYIDKINLAYIKFDTYRELNKKEMNFTRIDYTETSIFDKKDSLWYLKHYKYISNKKSKKERFKLTVEYVTTNIEDDSVKSFSYDEEFNQLDVISRTETNISDDFFKEYNSVITQSESLKNQVDVAFKLNIVDSLRIANQKKNISDTTFLIKPEMLKKNKANNLLKILTGLQMDWNVSYTPIQAFDQSYKLNLNNIAQSNWAFSRSTKANDLPILLGLNFFYHLNKRWIAIFQPSKSLGRLGNTKVYRRDIGIAYRFVFNRSRKPIIFEPSIKYGTTKYGVRFGETKNIITDKVIDDKKFNSKEVSVGLFEKSKGLKFGVSTTIYSKKARKLFLNLDYLLPIQTVQPSVQIKEVGFFQWFPKKVNLDLDDKRVLISDKANLKLPQIKNNFWFGLSYRVGI